MLLAALCRRAFGLGVMPPRVEGAILEKNAVKQKVLDFIFRLTSKARIDVDRNLTRLNAEF
ncbi:MULTISPECIES: hypothetical protein [unclassified Rhizobium]|uniref:hypothetical protein n=1 Tax=unclassified Rhizobium TaxID=2613769 RepID=UPI0011AB485C|nr:MULTISPECIES: hypothetical protein [unclassified Rhizobium]